MKKQKRIWISLLLSFILIIVLSGCSGVIGPKTAKINITIDPNPVPYDSEDEDWSLNVILSESNGVGVTLSSLRFDGYNQEEQLFDTQFLYEEGIIDWFESNYLPAFSSLQSSINYSMAPGDEFAKYTVLTIEGVDDNDNPIEATGRVDHLPK